MDSGLHAVLRQEPTSTGDIVTGTIICNTSFSDALMAVPTFMIPTTESKN